VNRFASVLGRTRQSLGERLVRPTAEIPFAAARPFLPPDPVILEAGASIGMDLPSMLSVWPDATIHAFEPEPVAYAELMRRAASMPRVTPWNLALGRENGEIELHVSQGTYGTMSSSLLEPALTLEAHPEVTYDRTRVKQRTLSSWAAENRVERIDFLALDMQGFEHAALDGSRDLLRSASAILSETFLVEMYDGAATVERLQALLTAEDFVILETRIFYARTFALFAVSRAALEGAIYSGRLATHGSAGAIN
jgi:2-O-methyltransferase